MNRVLDIITDASDRYGVEWDVDSMLEIACTFIEDQKLTTEFAAYVDGWATADAEQSADIAEEDANAEQSADIAEEDANE